ncbi:ATP-binding protein [Aquiflexum sp.]|uniref:ATP-binding protein n=1 Tax=Aquiflexum sp. TaxID=1872584 RepID=UPI003592EB07
MNTKTLKHFYKNPVLTGFIGFLLTLTLTQLISYRGFQLYQSSEQQSVINQKNSLEKKIAFGLRHSFSAIKTLAYLEENFGITGNFEEVAREILESNQHIDAIQLLEGGSITHVYPLEGNESVIGYNILEDSSRNREAMLAMESKNVFFAGPLELKQGGMGIVGRIPIFKENSFWGFAAVVVRLETFYKMIDYAGLEKSEFYVQFSKYNPDTGIIENFLPLPQGDYTGFESSSFLTMGNWKLTVQLKKSNAFNNIILPLILRVVFSIMIGFFVWYLAGVPAILEEQVARQSRRLKESNERFEYATMATSDVIWDWDLLNNKVYRSENFEKLFGYKISDINNNRDFWNSKIHPEDMERANQNLKETLEGKDNFWKQEFRLQKSNGKYTYVLDKGIIIRDESGKAVRLIGATQDISEIKANEKALFQMSEELRKRAQELEISNSELEQFAYVASHDLQEPLRMISSFMKLLEKKYRPLLDDRGNQYIQFAIEGAERMRHIILDLLEYSRVENVGQKEKVDLNELMEEIKLLEKKLIQDRKAEVVFNKLPEVMASQSPMRQLFQNLIHNSLKYSSNGRPPVVEINAEDMGGFWKFRVKDNGIGISEEYHEKVFQVFQRLHSREVFKGTGLGLAICKKIVKKFGGEIWIDSEEDMGTTVFFTLKKDMAEN